MEFEFTWIDSSLVVCRASGMASVDGLAALIKALVSQPEFRPGVKVLADHSRLDISVLSAGEIERIADVRAIQTAGMKMHSALVVGPCSPFRYGLARMFEAYVASRGDESIKVFESFDEGMAWLQALDSPSPSELSAEDAEVDVNPAR